MKLARQYGAIASVKDGNLLFIRQGQGKTASGKPLPVITITRMTETVTGLASLTGEHIRVLSLTGCIPGNRKRKKLQR